jgi:hypothetical protein
MQKQPQTIDGSSAMMENDGAGGGRWEQAEDKGVDEGRQKTTDQQPTIRGELSFLLLLDTHSPPEKKGFYGTQHKIQKRLRKNKLRFVARPNLSMLLFSLLRWEDKAIGQGATRNAGEDYWPWPGRSPMRAQPLIVMIK